MSECTIDKGVTCTRRTHRLCLGPRGGQFYISKNHTKVHCRKASVKTSKSSKKATSKKAASKKAASKTRIKTFTSTTFLSLAHRLSESERVRAIFAHMAPSGDVICSKNTNRLWSTLHQGARLGQGTWGAVYKASHDKLHQPIAIKFTRMTELDMKHAYEPQYDAWEEVFFLRMIHQLLSEGQVCPNLPLLHADYGCSHCNGMIEKASGPCLVTAMELARGDLDDISRKLWRKPQSLSFWYSVLFQIGAALECIHTRLWLHHRDVKSANILCYEVPAGGHWTYVIQGQTYHVPNHGWMMVLADFNVAQCLDPRYDFFRQKKRRSLGNRALIVDETTSVAEILNHDGKDLKRVKLHGATRDSHMRDQQSLVQQLDHTITDEVRWSEAQRSVLKKAGYSKDVSTDFLLDSQIQFPLEFGEDTQDMIRMFTGGKRMTMADDHDALPRVPRDLVRELKRFLTQDSGDVTLNKTHTGFFLRDFFGSTFQRHPAGSEELGQYAIS